MTEVDSFRRATYAGLAADDFGSSDERPPIVLLHGMTFDRTMWRSTLAELEVIDPGRRAVALDLPGHGDSPDAPSYTIPAVAARVHAAIVDAGLHNPVLVGHSGSAGTVAMYAGLHPTSGVIEVEGTFVVTPFAEMVQAFAPVLRGPGFDAVWSRIAENAFRLADVPDEVRTFVEETSRPRQEIVLGYWKDLLDRAPAELAALVANGAAGLRAAGVEVTMVVGQNPSSAEVDWLRANLPDARTLVWPGSGHFPHLAHPGAFAELMAQTGAPADRPAVASAQRTIGG
jgi:pimeloyl-ACP methyl ester carboxylesterase